MYESLFESFVIGGNDDNREDVVFELQERLNEDFSCYIMIG